MRLKLGPKTKTPLSLPESTFRAGESVATNDGLRRTIAQHHTGAKVAAVQSARGVVLALPSMRLATESPPMEMPTAKRFMASPLITLESAVSIQTDLRGHLRPVQLDLQDRVIADGLGVGRCAGLGVAVYGHALGYGRQRRLRGDGRDVWSWNVEVDGVGARVALASWMAALKVQNAPKLTTLHVPFPGLTSALSSDRLTVKVVEACTAWPPTTPPTSRQHRQRHQRRHRPEVVVGLRRCLCIHHHPDTLFCSWSSSYSGVVLYPALLPPASPLAGFLLLVREP